MSDNDKSSEPLIVLMGTFSRFLEKNSLPGHLEPEAKVTDVEVLPAPTKIKRCVKEFRCMKCEEPFERSDCGIKHGGKMVSIKSCPFCKSDIVVRQISDHSLDETKYDVDPAEQIMGPKGSKYARMNATRQRRG